MKPVSRITWARTLEPWSLRYGSFCAFSLNGKSQGVAFVDLREGTWHPAVSLFTKPLAVTPEEDGQDLKDPHKWAVAEDKGDQEPGRAQTEEARLTVRFDGFAYPPPALAGLVAQARELAAREREAAGFAEEDLAGVDAGEVGEVRAARDMSGPPPPEWRAPSAGEGTGAVKEEGGMAGGAQ